MYIKSPKDIALKYYGKEVLYINVTSETSLSPCNIKYFYEWININSL